MRIDRRGLDLRAFLEMDRRIGEIAELAVIVCGEEADLVIRSCGIGILSDIERIGSGLQRFLVFPLLEQLQRLVVIGERLRGREAEKNRCSGKYLKLHRHAP